MQDLDSYIFPIPGFEGDIPIPAILVLARSPSGELASDPSAGASKTQAGKRKATATPTPQKKAKKATGKSLSGIKINEPAPKASPALNPLMDSRQKNPNPPIKKVYLLWLLFILDQFVIHEPLCRVPQDINLDSSTKNVSVGGKSPKANKPLTPNTKETAPKSLKPPSPGGAHSSPGTGGAPSLSAWAASSLGPVGAFYDPELAESPKTFPKSPRSYWLGAAGGYQPGEGWSVPQSKKQLWQYSWVVESLFDNCEFIQAGFHIGRFITAVVDTEVDQANIKALYLDLKLALTHLNVSVSYLHYNIFAWFWFSSYANIGGALWGQGAIPESSTEKDDRDLVMWRWAERSEPTQHNSLGS
jgi:hypothetical protein